MAQKLDPKDTVSSEELLRSLVYTQEAPVNLLEKKGLLMRNEVLEEIKRLKAETERGK